MPEVPGAIPVQCAECSAHFQLDPAGDMAGAACSECGGNRFFMNQPSPTQSDGTMRNMVDSISQKDQGGNPLGEGTIVGDDGEKPRGFRDNYMHSKVANPSFQEIVKLRHGLSPDLQRQADELYQHQGEHAVLDFLRQLSPSAPPQGNNGFPYWDSLQTDNGSQTVAKLEMRTSNTEPYVSLWEEAGMTKTAGPALEFGAPLVGEVLDPEVGAAAAGGAGGAGGSGLMKALPFALPTLMRGILGQGQGGMQSGGMAPQMPTPPTPAPSMEMMSSTDIPRILLADYDTPHSVKSIGEQHDNPENQDQKEFNDGDKSPKNLENPNNEDTGADGEDGVRDATPGYGIGPNSPSLERAQMILPLLLHYFNSEESGQSDPLIRALHDALEQESPGYLENEHPEGQKYVELVIQNHKSPHSIQAGVNAFPSGLPSMPQPGGMNPGGAGGGTCPVCGGVLAGDGSCPQCGSKQHPQGGMDMGTATGIGTGMSSGGASYPPNRVGNAQGPVTDEQKQVLHQAIDDPSMAPLFGEILNKIQNQQNSPPLVDPSQMTPPSPMPGMMNPPGAMPGGMDASQMGGGGGMPMQPMAHQAAPYGRDDRWPSELPGPHNPESFHYLEPGQGLVNSVGMGRCPQCGQESLTPYNGICQNGDCGFTMPKDSQDVALPQYDPQGAHTLSPGDMDLGGQPPRWGKQADANNSVPRCPKCNCATTSALAGIDDEGQHKGRCHNCGHVWSLGEKEGHVVLADLPNPVLENAADRTDVHPEHNQDSTLTWKDASGQPLAEGQTYELHTPGYDVPDEVQVAGPPKPDQLDLKLVGLPAGIQGISQDGQKDFSITPQQMQMMGYTFVPTGQADNVDSANAGNFGGMPGLEQIPQTPPTTDETSTSYPNPGTVSSAVASNDPIDPYAYEDVCHKCGANWVEHIASSPTTLMHECARCGTVWETSDNFEGREAHADLNWIREDSSLEDFSDRQAAMMEHGTTSRNISDVAARDERLQAVRGVLSRNAMERTAGRHFSPSEQRSLINERGTARNLEDLDLSNTHYESRYDETGKANPMNVPDAHLLMGI